VKLLQKKQRLAGTIIEQISGGKGKYLEQKFWALNRLASRRLLYAGAESIVPPQVVENWFAQLASLPRKTLPLTLWTAFITAAGRRVGQRSFDISDESRKLFLAELVSCKGTPAQLKMVSEVVEADQGSWEQLFGEQLPPGLLLVP
jgi:hypothetical protein